MKTLISLVVILILYQAGYAQKNVSATPIQQTPVIPVGLDAYRMWDHWPLQRIGARAYMRSTYDRNGGNEAADASHFLFMGTAEDENVTLDIRGKGMLYFFRANHWHGSPWHFTVDGIDNVVRESGTNDPVTAKQTLDNPVFVPSGPFPQPLNWTWATTKGADLIWSPMPFNNSFRIAYSRTRYGTGYYIYHLYANEDRLSQPLKSWSLSDIPDKEVTDLIALAGSDIAPKNIQTKKGKVVLNKPGIVLATINNASSSIRAFKLIIPMAKAYDLERLRLKITWDNSKYPSVLAPLCLFFGAGTFYNRESKEFLVKGFPINIRYDYSAKNIELACYYPMPFTKSAKIELEGITPGDTELFYEIRYEPLTVPFNQSAYFHATYRDMPSPVAGVDLELLDTKGIEGKDVWSGSFVGTSFIFSHNGVLNTLEGDPRFFFDDSKGAQAYGTGTEEWGGGGDYWGGLNMTLPFAGHPCGAIKREAANDPKDLIESAYRFLLADLMPFGRRAVIKLEHGGENLSSEHYETVTYWYGLPAASLIKTDSLDIGDIKSEEAHKYISPTASAIDSVRSRYEWGVDHFPAATNHGVDIKSLKDYAQKVGAEIYPSHWEDGRVMKGTSTFNVQLHPFNAGVLLRRTLDYSYANQTAEVFVKGKGSSSWQHAGIWYLAGSNTCLFSDASGEMGPRKLNVQTSNRRFRDDEFLLPAQLTQGYSEISLRIVFIPNDQELHPGFPFPMGNGWSELKYDVYSYILPHVSGR